MFLTSSLSDNLCSESGWESQWISDNTTLLCVGSKLTVMMLAYVGKKADSVLDSALFHRKLANFFTSFSVSDTEWVWCHSWLEKEFVANDSHEVGLCVLEVLLLTLIERISHLLTFRQFIVWKWTIVTVDIRLHHSTISWIRANNYDVSLFE